MPILEFCGSLCESHPWEVMRGGAQWSWRGAARTALTGVLNAGFNSPLSMSHVPDLDPDPNLDYLQEWRIEKKGCGLFLSTPFPAFHTSSNWKFGWPCLFTWLKCSEVVFIFSWRVLSSAALHSLPLRSLWERQRSVAQQSNVCVCVCVCVCKEVLMEVVWGLISFTVDMHLMIIKRK